VKVPYFATRASRGYANVGFAGDSSTINKAIKNPNADKWNMPHLKTKLYRNFVPFFQIIQLLDANGFFSPRKICWAPLCSIRLD